MFPAEQLISHTCCTINIIHTSNILLKPCCQSVFTKETKCFPKFFCLRKFPAITPEHLLDTFSTLSGGSCHVMRTVQCLREAITVCWQQVPQTYTKRFFPFTRMNVHYMTVFPNTARLKGISEPANVMRKQKLVAN